jgi:hypothetical protein
MDTNAWLTVAAITVSPVIAVGITLWIEGRRRTRDGKLLILRQLMVTRHLPADPNYSAAVNLVPVEFNHDPAVMTEYKSYQTAINQLPNNEPEAIARSNSVVITAQTKMIFAIMRSLKLKASEADLPVEAYASRGMIERDNLYLDSLRAQTRIAKALEEQQATPI